MKLLIQVKSVANFIRCSGDKLFCNPFAVFFGNAAIYRIEFDQQCGVASVFAALFPSAMNPPSQTTRIILNKRLKNFFFGYVGSTSDFHDGLLTQKKR